MLRKLINNINYNFDQALASVSIVAIGASLLYDRNYFSWPPELRFFMNAEWLDVIILVFGFGLLWCSLNDNKHKAVQQILLIVCSTIMIVLAVTQICHAAFAGQLQMGHTVIGDVVIIALLWKAALES